MGYYLILPSSSYSLLIKSIATSELLLPIEVNQQVESPPDSAVCNVQECLDKLEVMTSYNPLLVSSQLTTTLSTVQSNKRSSNVKPTPAKRKYQPPPVVQPVTVRGGGKKPTTSLSTRKTKNVHFTASNEPHAHSSAPRKGYAPLDSTLK